MKAFGDRIGLYRVAALLIACALVLEIVRIQVLVDRTAGQIACTFGEVVFLALAATVYFMARRRQSRSG